MKVSLGTRVFAAYFVLLILLGGVALFSLLSMEDMRREVQLLRQLAFPQSGRLQRLAADLGRVQTALQKGSGKDLLWLQHTLGEIRPFEVLADVQVSLHQLAASEELDTAVASDFGSLGDDVMEVLTGRGLASHQSEEGMTNRQAYELAAGGFLAALASPSGSTESWREWPSRRELLVLVSGLRDEVSRLDPAVSEVISDSWTHTTGREDQALTFAIILALASLIVVAVTILLFVIWFKPLLTLRKFAQKISVGDYNQPLDVKGSPEIMGLADELRSMAHKLREREEMIRNQAKELVKADRFSTIGKMSTQIAHEIRNPLNAMGLKLELLEEIVEEASGNGRDNREIRDAVVAIGKEIDRLREITDYYLKFAKFPRVEKEHIDLSVVINDLVMFYRDEAKRKGIEVDLELDRQLRCQADPNLLRHAVANLLRNSIEALQQSQVVGGRITFRAWRDEGCIRVQVKDNGPGIPKDAMDHIFEPFFSTKKTGTGLGLTLVHQVVKEHSGEVRASSEPGEGTVFTITIPEQ